MFPRADSPWNQSFLVSLVPILTVHSPFLRFNAGSEVNTCFMRLMLEDRGQWELRTSSTNFASLLNQGPGSRVTQNEL